MPQNVIIRKGSTLLEKCKADNKQLKEYIKEHIKAGFIEPSDNIKEILEEE